jgi:ABC-type multidrug transport system permease subunit
VTSPVVEIETLARRFGSFTAVDSLALAASAGEVFGVFFARNAIYSTSIMPAWLKVISHLNPLTYVVDALRTSMLGGSASSFGRGIDSADILAATVVLVMIDARFTHSWECRVWPEKVSKR